MRQVICPYKGGMKGGNECAHKYCWKQRGTKKNKGVCRYKIPNGCSLYKEWLQKSKIKTKRNIYK